MRYLKNRPILVDIATVFLLLLLAITGAIIHNTYQQSKTSALKMGITLIESDHQQVVDELTRFLSPESFVKVISQFIKDGTLTRGELRSLASFMHVLLSAHPEFNNVYISDERGNIFFENRYKQTFFNEQFIRFASKQVVPAQTHFISELVSQDKGHTTVELIFKDQLGKVILTSKKAAQVMFDEYLQPWYKGVQQHPKATWVDFSTVFGTPEESLVLAQALMVEGQFRGVVAADINLVSLRTFLEKLVTYDQAIFIVDDKQKMIAQANHIPSIDIPWQATCQKKGYAGYDLYNETYLIYCTQFQVSSEKNWHIISVTPLDVFIGDLKQSNRKNVLFSAILVGLGLILVFFFARKISIPLMKLAYETKKLSQFDASKKINLKTHIYEINVLLEAMYAFRRTAYSFSKYIPKVLVEKLLEQKMIAKFGGQKKEMTVLFTDIENFTTLAEKLDPSVLLEHMSSYFEVMTSTIHAYTGTVDKYIGDAVMAFWGAPLDNPEQAMQACSAVLACRQKLRELNDTWKSSGKPLFHTRFGLAMGDMVVGNVGSSDRLNYTVIGDNVNLASRLESLNKIYGTDIIVNEHLYQACRHAFIFRPLDHVIVKGKSESVCVYQLLGEVPGQNLTALSATSDDCVLATQFTAAFDLLMTKKAKEAYALFLLIAERYPNDVPTQCYITRLKNEHVEGQA